MKKKTIIIVAVIVVAVAATAGLALRGRGTKPLEVQTTEASQARVVQKVTASGKVQPKTQVKISADVSARIIRLGVTDGDRVESGQFLVELDREAYLAAVESSQASVRSVEANANLVRESMLQAEREFNRAKEIVQRKLDSQSRLDAAEAAYKVEVARYESALGDVARAKASLIDVKPAPKAYWPMPRVWSTRCQNCLRWSRSASKALPKSPRPKSPIKSPSAVIHTLPGTSRRLIAGPYQPTICRCRYSIFSLPSHRSSLPA